MDPGIKKNSGVLVLEIALQNREILCKCSKAVVLFGPTHVPIFHVTCARGDGDVLGFIHVHWAIKHPDAAKDLTWRPTTSTTPVFSHVSSVRKE